jgi:hypothetical protein
VVTLLAQSKMGDYLKETQEKLNYIPKISYEFGIRKMIGDEK